jgi:SAM-dependent methyltransferase
VKPYSEAAVRNREPIREVLAQWFTAPGTVLEIGAGTGQHAVYLAAHLPHLEWQPTDRDDNLPGIALWVEEARLPNLRRPQPLDVNADVWPLERTDYVYSANTAHIMSWQEVQRMFAGIGRVLRHDGVFCLYGPFNRNGEFTSESNRAFDASLRARASHMGIRDDGALIELARAHGLAALADYSLPANNRVLVWRRASRES